MRRRSIRFRFYRELLIFGVLLVVGGGFGLLTVYLWGVEDAARLTLLIEAELEAKNEFPDVYGPRTRGHQPGRVWMSLDEVPADVLEMFPPSSHRDDELLVQYSFDGEVRGDAPSRGFDMNLLSQSPDAIHLFMRYRLLNGEAAYVTHTSPTRGYRDMTRQDTVTLIILLNCVILVAVMLLFAKRLASVVVRPLSELSHMAANIDETSPDLPVTATRRREKTEKKARMLHYLRRLYRWERQFWRDVIDLARQNDEVGDVARTLQRSMRRIHQFHQREKNFLRHASHELRTPIAVIASALDVLDQRRANGVTDLERPMADIRRAADDMRDTVEALLWLGRMERETASRTATDIGELIETVVADHAHLLQDRGIGVEREIAANAVLDIEQVYLRIVLSNLVRNAFEHADGGTVSIAYADRRFVISNERKHAAAQGGDRDGDGGFGMGIPLIEAVAAKLGWTLEFHTAPGSVTAILHVRPDGEPSSGE